MNSVEQVREEKRSMAIESKKYYITPNGYTFKLIMDPNPVLSCMLKK